MVACISMDIAGNRATRATVERESFAANPRKSVGAGVGDGRLYIGSGLNQDLFDAMEADIDEFFNRDANADEHVFNEQNGYYVNLPHLRRHVVLSVLEWTEQITDTDYQDVDQAAYTALITQIDELIRDDGETITLGQMERRAGGIPPKANGQIQLNIRPTEGDGALGWHMLRLAILRISRIYIERHPNAGGGMDYFFGLEVHPDFRDQMGNGQFELLEQIVEQDPGFNPQDVEDTRRRVVREQAVREGAAQFRGRVRDAYGDVCAVTECDEARGMDAAHIMDYRGRQTNHVTNGMLLRTDIHRLFDRGLLRINAPDVGDWTIVVDPSLAGTEPYGGYDGQVLHLPANPAHRPNIEALRETGWLVD